MYDKIAKFKSKKILVIVILSIMLTFAIAVAAVAADVSFSETSTDSTAGVFRDVVSFDVGSAETEIGIESDENCAPWGPSSFALDSNGTIYIIDGVNLKFLVVEPDGVSKRSIDFAKEVINPVDIQVVDGHIFALDLPSMPAKVHEIDMDGSVLNSWPIPSSYVAENISGFNVEIGKTDKVSINLEIEACWSVPFVKNGKLAATTKVPKVHIKEVIAGNKIHRVDLPSNREAEFSQKTSHSNSRFLAKKNWSERDKGSVTIFNGSNIRSKIIVKADKFLSSLKFVAVDKFENAYVYAEENSDSRDKAAIKNRAFVKKYSMDGTEKGYVEIPVNEFYTYPTRAINIDDDGFVFVMVPKKDKILIKKSAIVQPTATASSDSMSLRIFAQAKRCVCAASDLVKLGFSKATKVAISAFELKDAKALPWWTKDDANDMAWDYISNSWYCTYADYTRNCGDQKPRYITTYNHQWYSVPYCWGGWHLPSHFNYYMQNDYKNAGDINCTGGKRYCTSGTDCSGYVTRIWGLSSKKSTYDLDNWPYSIAGNKNNMQEADIYNWAGHHVVLFRYYSSSGYSAIFEATKANSYDRCVNTIRANSYFNNYGAYKRAEWGI